MDDERHQFVGVRLEGDAGGERRQDRARVIVLPEEPAIQPGLRALAMLDRRDHEREENGVQQGLP